MNLNSTRLLHAVLLKWSTGLARRIRPRIVGNSGTTLLRQLHQSGKVYFDRCLPKYEPGATSTLKSHPYRNRSAIIQENDATKDESSTTDCEEVDEIVEIDTNNAIKLREYQLECIEAIAKTLEEEKLKRIAISIATGGGKTVIFTMAIPRILELSRFPGDNANGVLILVHRRELATQTIKTIQNLKVVDDDRVFLDMGKSRIDPERTFNDSRPFIVVGSVPTLSRSDCARLSDYRLDRFKAVIVDECHHSVSDSYMNLLATLGCSRKKPKDIPKGELDRSPFLLGFTATLARTDKVPLRKVFDKIVFQKGISDLIKENHLCDFDWLKVELGLNLDDVETSGGDFRLDSLAEHVNTEEINEVALKTYLQLRSQYPDNMKSLLVFCVNVKHMQDVSALFRANGINAQYVSGETKSAERDNIVSDFKAGKVSVLFNCGVFTEGTDIPNIDSIFLLRPTKSKPLLVQMVGRGLRLSEGKNKLIVTDFVDNKSLGLTITSTLNGKPDVISLLGGLSRSGFKHRDDLLPGDVEYIKFKNFSGMKMLEEIETNKSLPFQLLKNMRMLNRTKVLNTWTQVKFDAWATSCGYNTYIKVEVTKNATYKASYYIFKAGFNGSKQLINTSIDESEDFDELVDSITKFVDKSSYIKDQFQVLRGREQNMIAQSITKTQTNFILSNVQNIVKSNMSNALDYDKFSKELESKVKSMTRMEAYEVIFAYTVSRSNALMLWVRNTFMRTKEQKREITKDAILQHNEKLTQDGWV